MEVALRIFICVRTKGGVSVSQCKVLYRLTPLPLSDIFESTMAFNKQNSPKRQLLPEVVTLFLHKRLKETVGLCLMVTASILWLSLFSYDGDDPSLSTAVNGPVQNHLGIWGAYIADFFVQFIGPIGQLLSALLLIWGGRLVIHRPLNRLGWKILSFGISLLLISIGLKALDIYSGVVANWVGSYLKPLYAHHFSLRYISATFFISTGTLAFLYALSLTWEEWKSLFAMMKRGLQLVVKAALSALSFSYSLISKIPLKRGGGLRQEPVMAPLTEDLPINTPEDERDYYVAPPKEEPAYDQPVEVTPSQPADDNALSLNHDEGDYQLPPLNLLQKPPSDTDKTRISKRELEENAIQLKGVLEDFGIRGDVVSVRPGPVVTLYELVPAPGIKASRIISLADDIARSMSAISARVAVIPGKNAIGIELPNTKRQTVYLRELFADKDYEEAGENLSLVLGKDISGHGIIQDLARMPHLLVAGTTGSGKSVAVNAMILSILFRLTPDQCKFIMIDPKMLEFSAYDGIPHLITPVVTDPKKAIVALKWVVREMENRYKSMSETGVRNIHGYNEKLKEARDRGETLTRRVQTGFDPDTGKAQFEDQPLDMEPLPNIVVVVDEMADLMLVAGKEVEAAIQRLAQMARAAGIHLIMATQRPSVDVITGTIKANFPTRISFQVTSKIDSRTILGEGGAEQLLGQGDMLFMAGGGRITRVHGPFVSDVDVEKVVKFLKSQRAPSYVDTVTQESDEPSLLEVGKDKKADGDDLFAKAVDVVRRERKASTSFIQRCLQIGYNRAANVVDQLEKEGIVSPANHVGRREVLIPPLNDQA